MEKSSPMQVGCLEVHPFQPKKKIDRAGGGGGGEDEGTGSTRERKTHRLLLMTPIQHVVPPGSTCPVPSPRMPMSMS